MGFTQEALRPPDFHLRKGLDPELASRLIEHAWVGAEILLIIRQRIRSVRRFSGKTHASGGPSIAKFHRKRREVVQYCSKFATSSAEARRS
jgi:hypothetical protein